MYIFIQQLIFDVVPPIPILKYIMSKNEEASHYFTQFPTQSFCFLFFWLWTLILKVSVLEKGVQKELIQKNWKFNFHIVILDS